MSTAAARVVLRTVTPLSVVARPGGAPDRDGSAPIVEEKKPVRALSPAHSVTEVTPDVKRWVSRGGAVEVGQACERRRLLRGARRARRCRRDARRRAPAAPA